MPAGKLPHGYAGSSRGQWDELPGPFGPRYTVPLHLQYLVGERIHYGPQPWLAQAGQLYWTTSYYRKADSIGLGFDRNMTGSTALSSLLALDFTL